MSRPRGFTLLEVVIVLALSIFLVTGIVILSTQYLRDQQARTVADVIVAEILQAQAESFAQRNDAVHGVEVLTDRVVRFEGASYAARDQNKDITTTFPVPVSVSGTVEIVFPEASLAPLGGASTTTITQNTTQFTITVSAYGVVDVQ